MLFRSGVHLSKLEDSGTDIYEGITLKAGGPSFHSARGQACRQSRHCCRKAFCRCQWSADQYKLHGLLNLHSWPDKEASPGIGTVLWTTEQVKACYLLTTLCLSEKTSCLNSNSYNYWHITVYWQFCFVFGDFGAADMDFLVQHFGEVLAIAQVATDKVLGEWRLLKALLYKRPNCQDMTWPQISALFLESCPNVLTLVDLLLIIPASTAEWECGFSHVKVIKNEYHTRPRPSVMTDLMRIQLLSPSVSEYDPQEAIALWHCSSLRSRRPSAPSSRCSGHVSESDCHDSRTDIEVLV